MNEAAQLKAMAAELAVQGYDVRQDVSGDALDVAGIDLSGLLGLKLDLVGALRRSVDEKLGRPSVLIVEIANRQRRRPREFGGGPWSRIPDDQEAMNRFQIISAAVAGAERIGFQIRFLDVSAEQAAARALTTKTKSDAVRHRLQQHQRLLARSAGRDDLSRALLIARLWSYWLRVTGHLYPGRGRRELKAADLRTIQKDLFDHKVLTMRPAAYRPIHAALMAIFEGGDFEPAEVLGLEAELRSLLTWASDHYGLSFEREESLLGGALAQLRDEIRARVSGARLEEIETAIVAAAFTRGSSAFARSIAHLQLVLGREPWVSEGVLNDLLEEASQ